MRKQKDEQIHDPRMDAALQKLEGASIEQLQEILVAGLAQFNAQMRRVRMLERELERREQEARPPHEV